MHVETAVQCENAGMDVRTASQQHPSGRSGPDNPRRDGIEKETVQVQQCLVRYRLIEAECTIGTW